jgi:ATPase subunit of ABC transporter with duplicated ATPase domains
MDKLADLRLPEVIVPTFSLKPNDINSCMLVSITDGFVGYALDKPILSNIHLSLMSTDRLAITGDNGSGKSTLIKGILNDSALFTSGVWLMPERAEIGYLDQQYATLDSTKTVFETIHQLMPNPTHAEIRKHLNDFLFRKNEEVNLPVAKLSGGERVRLSLAQIGAKTPRLLILDEVTNNLDLETRNHVIEVLRLYPGAIIVISHDKDFLDQIGVRDVCDVHKNLPL